MKISFNEKTSENHVCQLYVGSESEVTQSCPTATPWTVAYQAPPSMGFSRQEYWSGLPLPSAGDLPSPEIEPGSPALQADSLPSEPSGKPYHWQWLPSILRMRDFPDGQVVKNLPSNAGDTGSISGLGTKIPCARAQLSPCTVTTEPACHN